MRELLLLFGRDHGLLLLCSAAIVGAAWWLCHSRLRRLRQRARLARDVEDALVQNAQGLIVKVHGLVKDLASNDPLRIRVEQALDRADELLSEDRERVQTLRAQALLDGELLQPPTPAGSKCAPIPTRPAPGNERLRRWLNRALRWLGWKGQ